MTTTFHDNKQHGDTFAVVHPPASGCWFCNSKKIPYATLCYNALMQIFAGNFNKDTYWNLATSLLEFLLTHSYHSQKLAETNKFVSASLSLCSRTLRRVASEVSRDRSLWRHS